MKNAYLRRVFTPENFAILSANAVPITCLQAKKLPFSIKVKSSKQHFYHPQMDRGF